MFPRIRHCPARGHRGRADRRHRARRDARRAAARAVDRRRRRRRCRRRRPCRGLSPARSRRSSMATGRSSSTPPSCSSPSACLPGTTPGWRSMAASLPPRSRGRPGGRARRASADGAGGGVRRRGAARRLGGRPLPLRHRRRPASSGSALLAGGLLGVARRRRRVTGLSYLGLLAIPQRHIFTVTGWLITLLAAGMAAQAVFYLNAADVLPSSTARSGILPAILSQSSIPGLVLHTLIGYTDRPTAMQIIAYLATIAAMVAPDALRAQFRPQADHRRSLDFGSALQSRRPSTT